MQARFFPCQPDQKITNYFRAGVQFSLSIGLGIAAGLAVGALEKNYDANALWDWHWVTASDITTAIVSAAASQFLQFMFDRCCPIDPQAELESQPLHRFSRISTTN